MKKWRRLEKDEEKHAEAQCRMLDVASSFFETVGREDVAKELRKTRNGMLSCPIFRRKMKKLLKRDG